MPPNSIAPKLAKPAKTPRLPLFGLTNNDKGLFDKDKEGTGSNWFYRRALIFIVSFFCMAVIAYAMLNVTPVNDSLYQAITYAAFSLLGIVVTGYAITASTEDTKTRELYLKYGDAVMNAPEPPDGPYKQTKKTKTLMEEEVSTETPKDNLDA